MPKLPILQLMDTPLLCSVSSHDLPATHARSQTR